MKFLFKFNRFDSNHSNCWSRVEYLIIGSSKKWLSMGRLSSLEDFRGSADEYQLFVENLFQGLLRF